MSLIVPFKNHPNNYSSTLLINTSQNIYQSNPSAQDVFMKNSSSGPLLFGMYKKKLDQAQKRKDLIAIHPKANYTDKNEAIQHAERVKKVSDQAQKISNVVQDTTGIASGTMALAASAVLVAHGADFQTAHHISKTTIEATVAASTGVAGVAVKKRVGDSIADTFYSEDDYPKLSHSKWAIVNDVAQNRRRPSLEDIHYFDEEGNRHFSTISSQDAEDLRTAKYFQEQNKQELHEALEYEHQLEYIENHRRDLLKYQLECASITNHYIRNNPDHPDYGKYMGPISPSERVKRAKENKEKGDHYYNLAFSKALNSFQKD